jgi:Bacterial cadherin-like domain
MLRPKSFKGGRGRNSWGAAPHRWTFKLFVAAIIFGCWTSAIMAWVTSADTVAWFGDTPALTLNATPFGAGSTRFSAAGPSTDSAGATITMVSLTSPAASVNRANNITATSQAQAVTNADYYYANLTVATQGLRVSAIRMYARSENNSTAAMTVSIYDTVLATQVFLDTAGVLIDTTAGSLTNVNLPITNTAAMVPGRMYQVRFYFWNCGGANQCYIDNPVISTELNENPVAQNDAFTMPSAAGVSGTVLANNGSGADSDIEAQALTVDQINGASFTVGSGISLANGTLTITNAGTGAFNFVPGSAAFTTQTFTYRINDGFGGTATATVTITDTRPRVTLRKISNGATLAFGFSGSNGIPNQTITTGSSGVAMSGSTTPLTSPATSTQIVEASVWEAAARRASPAVP